MSPTDMKFTADQINFIRNALICYKEHFQSRAGQKMYSLKIRPQVLHWKVVNDEAVDSRVYYLEQYQSKIQTCDELLELTEPASCT